MHNTQCHNKRQSQRGDTCPEEGILASSFSHRGAYPIRISLHSIRRTATGRKLINRIRKRSAMHGLWPWANSSIHMCVTRKLVGGHRLIGWCGALVRLWCRIRGDVWRHWEDQHGSDRVFSASRGNSVVEVGWRQVARVELAVCDGRSIVVVAEDLKKCYEYVRFNKLVEKGARQPKNIPRQGPPV